MAKNKRNGLGVGIEAFFQERPENSVANTQSAVSRAVLEVKVDDIQPGSGQPRKVFDQSKIEQLAESIKEHGVIQPLIVHKKGQGYRIIAGERRWRAAKLAGLETVPVIEKDATEREILEIALIENIQREDLNPIEEAEAFDRLQREFDLTQETLSDVLSKSRSDIANSLRLLSLNKIVRDKIAAGELTKGHGKALLGLDESINPEKIVKTISENNLNVRQTEALVKKFNALKALQKAGGSEKPQVDVFALAKKDIEKKLKSKLGTRVVLTEKKGKGKIQIEYVSSDDRERLIGLLLGEDD
ncbi:MAG: ParB/RepB/Spo0J family partition protein [Clostridia bacterium]|jgi:ParB family chromosome partitioning protein|nr:ParB/RepB/Spo0J family partition protein [Clostridia bacterium]MBO7397593.1 ParB/RepB/Spo0J family partition protein [Clostridia bacterium]MBO7503491.1 ParB/RepB/Spo0J family partition protein [Clostridia bacterium]MBO7658449.1 ParB/RepB/Spo0J family partition protein [Clostridia bacterium]MBP5666369.1 ParB/RepB/Spo0J family partition protein [Clostridia bacterium]